MGSRMLLAASLVILGLFSTASDARSASLDEVLPNSNIWGKDLIILLANLRSWQAFGEKTVVVFSDRVIGAKAYENREVAEVAMSRLIQLLSLPPPRPRSPYSEMLSAAPADRRFDAAVIENAEDGSVRVAWIWAQAQLLRDGLTVAQVYEELGQPEQVTSQLVQSRGEMRPTVLTLHSYANGAVIFAESDLSPTPGIVDRVNLDVAAAAARIF